MVKGEFKAKMALAAVTLIPWMVEADTSEGVVAAPSYLPGEKLKKGDLPGGYNQSAAYSCQDPWDLFLTGDYIYWAWQEELMEIGTLITPTALGSSAFLNGSGQVIFQTPGYASGFQLGLGCDLRGMDDWNLYADYTWYKNSDDMTTQTSGRQIFAVSSSLLPYVQGATPGVLLADQIYSTAKVLYNNLDVLLERPFYFGRKLTANFFGGFQALWINQKTTANGSGLSFVGSDAIIANRVDGSFVSSTEQKSWGLGPKFGINSNWLLGYGLKVMGTASLSVLYTSYTTLQSSVTGVVSDINLANLSISQPNNYNTLNPVAETFLGLGWGSYFSKNNFHFDLSAGYDFKVFWSQNLIDVLINSDGSPGTMSLRGLNIQARFDF